jgi:hypothetical protein
MIHHVGTTDQNISWLRFVVLHFFELALIKSVHTSNYPHYPIFQYRILKALFPVLVTELWPVNVVHVYVLQRTAHRDIHIHALAALPPVSMAK